MQRHQGFTIVELMAVVSIVSILTVITLALYNDYAIRAKVSEGVVFAAEAKTSVSEYYYSLARMPTNNVQTGLAEPAEYAQFDHLRTLEIRATPTEGSIAITFNLPGSPSDGKELWLVPTTTNGTVYWSCYAPEDNGIDVNQVPPNCRGN